MYRLFCNDRVLISKKISEEAFEDKEIIGFSTLDIDNVIVRIKSWLADSSVATLDLSDCDVGVAVAAIKAVFRPAPAAGGVVVIDNQFVAIERFGIPDLPKGHIEEGESPETAAMREVEEETGITELEIIDELPATWHCYQLNGVWTVKKTSWFLMETSSGMKNVPQTEEGISRIYLINIYGDDFAGFKEKTFASLRELAATIREKIQAGTSGKSSGQPK